MKILGYSYHIPTYPLFTMSILSTSSTTASGDYATAGTIYSEARPDTEMNLTSYLSSISKKGGKSKRKGKKQEKRKRGGEAACQSKIFA